MRNKETTSFHRAWKVGSLCKWGSHLGEAWVGRAPCSSWQEGIQGILPEQGTGRQIQLLQLWACPQHWLQILHTRGICEGVDSHKEFVKAL